MQRQSSTIVCKLGPQDRRGNSHPPYLLSMKSSARDRENPYCRIQRRGSRDYVR